MSNQVLRRLGTWSIRRLGAQAPRRLRSTFRRQIHLDVQVLELLQLDR